MDRLTSRDGERSLAREAPSLLSGGLPRIEKPERGTKTALKEHYRRSAPCPPGRPPGVTKGFVSPLPVDCAVSRSPRVDLAMNKAADAFTEHAIEIRFGQIGLVQVRIHTTDPGVILDELTGRTATAPQFFQRTAVCLDLSPLCNGARALLKFAR